MLSDLLGLTIDKGDLNKSSPSPVVNQLKKTAINYLAIGKMAEDLKLIKLNFSRYLAMEGVKVRGTPDAHFLKDDERTKKFNVLREKHVQSKMSAGAKDGTNGNKGWAKTLIGGYIRHKIKQSERFSKFLKFERNLTAAVLKKLRKVTALRKVIRLKRKIDIGIEKLIQKINIKKMFMNWIKTNRKKIIDPVIQAFKNAFGRFLKTGLQKLAIRFGTSFAASVWFSGPFAVLIAAITTIVLMIAEPLYQAWKDYTEGKSFWESFIVNVVDEFTFGIFGKDNIRDFGKSTGEWFDTMSKKVSETITEMTNYIKEKTTEFVNYLVQKGKSLLAPNDTPENFSSALDELNAKRAQEHNEMVEKYGKYFDEMGEKIEKTKIRIAELKVEIAILENEIKSFVEGPEKARLEEAKVEKAKEEQKLVELKYKQEKQFEGIGDPEEDVKKIKGEKTKPAPQAVTPAPAPKAAPTPAPKPSPAPAPMPAPAPAAKGTSPTQTSGEFSHIKQMLISYEGFKNKPYKDSKGLWTIGIGHKIGDGKTMPVIDPKFPELGTITQDTVLTNEQVNMIYEKDFAEHLAIAKKAPGWDLANISGKTAMIDLTYNMGYWWTKFKNAAKLFKEGKFKEGSDELKNSLWYKQVGERAQLDISLIKSGAKDDASGSAALASVMSSSKVASGGKFIQQESTQVAQAQREQLKPKDVNVADASKTNNIKKTNYQNVAMGDKPDLGEQMAKRAA